MSTKKVRKINELSSNVVAVRRQIERSANAGAAVELSARAGRAFADG
jgi:hypothetical protein